MIHAAVQPTEWSGPTVRDGTGAGVNPTVDGEGDA